jgi:hypothetical protein
MQRVLAMERETPVVDGGVEREAERRLRKGRESFSWGVRARVEFERCRC